MFCEHHFLSSFLKYQILLGLQVKRYFLRAIEIFYCAHFAEPLVFLNITQGKSQHNFIYDSTHLLLLTRYNAKILSFSRYCHAFLTYCLPLWFCARLRRLTRHTTPRIFFFKAESFFKISKNFFLKIFFLTRKKQIIGKFSVISNLIKLCFFKD